MTSPSHSILVADASSHREYMIDGFRVGFEIGGGCQCVCVEFATRASCRHTREVAGQLAAQSRIAERLGRGVSRPHSIRLMR